MHYKLLERDFLHEIDAKSGAAEANLRQTIRVVLQTDLHQTHDEANEDDRSAAYYLPGDHLAVYPENEASLVSALISRLSEKSGKSVAVAADRPYLVKIRSQQSQENAAQNGGIFANGHTDDDDRMWSLHQRLPAPVSLREALTRYLDITTPPTQQFLTILAETAENTADSDRMKHLANDSGDYETWKAKSYPNLLEVSRCQVVDTSVSDSKLNSPCPGVERILLCDSLFGAALHAAPSPSASLLLHLFVATLQLCLSD